MVKELTQNQTVTSDTSAAADLSIPIPEDGNNGWLGLGWMLAAMIPVAVGGGLLQPSINSLITQRVSKEGVGGTLGVSSALTSSANAIMPLVGGTLFKVLGYTAPFLFGGVFLLALFAIALRLLRETKPSG
jgi:MFS family permease